MKSKHQSRSVSTKKSESNTPMHQVKANSFRLMFIALFHSLGKSLIIFALGVSLIFSIGVAQRSGWLVSQSGGFNASGEKTASASRYICPMMCTPPASKPGRCPVCAMELVVATSAASNDGISITVDAHARRVAGITTAVAKSEELQRTIRAVGTIEFDESRLSTIAAHADGRIEKLFANYMGVEVAKGDNLALVYSPQIYTAQAEYIAGLDNTILDAVVTESGGLSELAKERLIEFGMTELQIQELSESRKPSSRIQLKSPQLGTVIEKNAVEGDYVKAGEPIFKVADLSTVWLILDLFPDDAALVRFGQIVQAEIQSIKDEVFTGRVAFISPTVNPRTKTVRVRVEVLNLDGELRPGDFATAKVTVPAMPLDEVYDPALAGKYISPMHPQLIRDTAGSCPLCGMDLIPTSELGFASQPVPGQEVITVPRDALLIAGSHAVVYVETEPGRFEIRQVSVGVLTDQKAVVTGGLTEGETVALNGNFLIDSQMQLIGNPSLIDPKRAPVFSSQPLALPVKDPLLFTNQLGEQIDHVYQLYFELQLTLSEDRIPSVITQNTLIKELMDLEANQEIPKAVKRFLTRARSATASLGGSIEDWRSKFRNVSHALLRVAADIRGPATSLKLVHYHCTMVPGNGGDWMQSEGKKQNPYWGSKMLRCGDLVRDLSVDAIANELAGDEVRQ